MSRPRSHRAVTVTFAVIVLLGVAGVALAWWSSGGSGAASATTGTSATLTLSPASPTAALYPGGSAAVRLSIVNGAASEVRVGNVALATAEGTDGFDVDSSHPDCAEASLAYTTQNNGGAGWTVPAGGTMSVTLPAAVTMSLDADDNCQGATIVVHLTAVG